MVDVVGLYSRGIRLGDEEQRGCKVRQCGGGRGLGPGEALRSLGALRSLKVGPVRFLSRSSSFPVAAGEVAVQDTGLNSTQY